LLGPFISPDLSTTNLSQLMDSSSHIKRLAFLFFAFGFPVGLVILAFGAWKIGGGRSMLVPAVLGGGVACSAFITPLVFGRETGGYYFGFGGLAIMISATVALWFWGRIRPQVPSGVTTAWDLLAAGGVCQVAAAWNLCGTAAMPSYLLFPDKSISLQTNSFAVGQLKSVMAMLGLGWVCLALAAYVGARFIRSRA